jgi:ABC-type uncharacterized transport system substrate-binding protein
VQPNRPFLKGLSNCQAIVLRVVHMFVLTLLLLSIPMSHSYGSESRPWILFLASYNPSFHSFFNQIDGFKAGLRERGLQSKDYILDIEFLDSKRFPIRGREHHIVQQLSYKFGMLPPYDLVVSADDTALKFVQKRRVSLFQGARVVFLGVNNVSLALEQNKNPDIVGVVEKRSVAETLELAARLFPKAGKIHVINDNTPTGRINRRILDALLKERPNLIVEHHSLTELTYKQLFKQFANLSPLIPTSIE